MAYLLVHLNTRWRGQNKSTGLLIMLSFWAKHSTLVAPLRVEVNNDPSK